MSLLIFFSGILIIAALYIGIIYLGLAIFLNKFNKLVYGKGSPMAWIPIANIYLLGKLAFNKVIGWVLVICAFLPSSSSTISKDGVAEFHTLLPY